MSTKFSEFMATKFTLKQWLFLLLAGLGVIVLEAAIIRMVVLGISGIDASNALVGASMAAAGTYGFIRQYRKKEGKKE